MKRETTKREPPGLGYAREACRRLHEAGEAVTTRAVLAEVARTRGVNISFRDCTPAVQAWREEQLARVSGRVDAAVDALLALKTPVERAAVRVAINKRSGGTMRVQFLTPSATTGKKRRQTPLPKTRV